MKPKPKSSFVCLFSPTMYPELGPKCLRGEKAKFPRGVFALGHNCNFRRKFTIRAAICKFYLNFFQVPLDLHSVLCYHLRNQYSQRKTSKTCQYAQKSRGTKRFSVTIDIKLNRNIVTIIENSFNCSEDISTDRIRPSSVRW